MKNQFPLFSIIVPIYKTEAYLHQCVDSILGQTFSDFEVILVDDGSPDGCPAICDEYAAKDPRVTVVHKQNGGLVSARKAGLAVAAGDYVVTVDSDDYLASDMLENIARAVTEHRPQAVLFGLTQFDGNETWPLKGLLPEGLYEGQAMETIRQNLIQDSRGRMVVLYGIAAAALERKTYAPFQNAVPDAVSRGEDLAVTAPMLSVCQRVYVSEACGYFYRNNPNSIMNTFRIEEPQRLKVLVEYLESRLEPSYQGRLDCYLMDQYFDFLDRAMLQGYGVYRQTVRATLNDWMKLRLGRAKCKGAPIANRLVYWLVRHRCFRTLWLLRRIKKRA